MRLDCLQGHPAVTWGLFSSLPAPLKGNSLSPITQNRLRGFIWWCWGLGPFWVDFPVGVSVSPEVLLCWIVSVSGCQGNWHSRSVCSRGSLCLLPSVTSTRMSFPGHCHYLPWGRRRAWLQQPVNLPAQSGEACAGSAELLCPSALTLLPQALPLPAFLGCLEAAACAQRSP